MLGRASVSGSDVDWRCFPVIEGTAYGLVLNTEEQTWLHTIWRETTSGHPAVGLYAGRDTELVHGKDSCRLTNNYCPLCLRKRREFEVHHCIAAADGGPDTASNLLAICNTCHATITRGSVEDRFPLATAALQHQLMYFGLQLIDEACTRPGRRARRRFEDTLPHELRESLEELALDPTDWAGANARLKSEARAEYQFRRDLGLGRWSWLQFEYKHPSPFPRQQDGT